MITLFPNIESVWNKVSGKNKPNNSKVHNVKAPVLPTKSKVAISPLKLQMKEQSTSMMKSLFESSVDSYLRKGLKMPEDQL